jgi:serine protease SohB
VSEFLLQYGLFLAQTVTLVAAILVVIGFGVASSRKDKGEGELVVRSLNSRYRELTDVVRRKVLPKKAFKAAMKARKAEDKTREDEGGSERRRVFVIDFHGDIKASGVAGLRKEVSAILAIARPTDEVLVRLDNQGGLVHEHGLAASQLIRIRDQGVPLTVVVDKVAASGGYMMACVANRIIAAPFSIIGSIGVLAQIPNFHQLLKEHGVEVEQLKAGRYKRTITMFGENTDADREKLTEELEEIHGLFRQMIGEHRPDMDLERLATGEHWLGRRALELGLVDELGTSDDYLIRSLETADLYGVAWKGPKTLQAKLAAAVEGGMAAALRGAWQSLRDSRFSAR